MSRDDAMRVLGEPESTFRLHVPKTIIGPTGKRETILPRVFPPDEADPQAFAYEWCCGGAAAGTACTAVESDGEFTLVIVCAIHAT